GDRVMGAAALAHTVLFAGYALGMGLVSAVAPLASQAFGARRPRLVRRSVRVGLWAALLAGVPLTALQLWCGEDILIALGQPQDAAELAGRYLAALAWCLVPSWAFIALRNFMSALNRPEPGLWITLAAIPLNGVLGYTLIYGTLGAPRLGIFGAGVATTLVNIAMCGAAVWFAYAHHPFKKFRVLGRFWRADWILLRRLLVVGLPISAAFLLEFGLFAAAALLMGRIGATALAAHAIALQTAAILFMVPFGISLAATVRVGHAAGRRDPGGTRRAGFAAIWLAGVFMAAMTLAVAVFRHVVPRLFLGAEAQAATETASLAATLLAVGATFFVTDGLQTVVAGALRGLNDTRVPLLAAVVGYWLAGFGASYGLALVLGFGAIGVWAGLSVGTTVFALLLLWRFHALTRAGYLPAAPGSA
ncbi:MAG: MATE family efflux transporter, partial [Hyphomicrobiaceae bacterium]|nr:MATE family efflux transporter [Hyphomicrobiaceae bacterium]